MSGVLKWLVAMIAAALAALCLAAPAAAAVPLQPCIARLDPAAGLARRQIDEPGSHECSVKQSSLGSGDFSVRLDFDPVLSQPADPLLLRHSSVWQDRERIMFLYADGATATVAFTSDDASRFLALGAMFEIPVPARAAPLTSIRIETGGSANWRGIILGPELVKRSEATVQRGWLIALYAGFAGLSLALLAYNLALWKALRQRFQLYYCAMVAALAGYTFTASGAIMLALPGLDNNDRLRINYVLLIVAGVAAFRFIVAFFVAENFKPWLRRAIDVVCALLIADTIAFALLTPWLGWLWDDLYFALGTALMALLFPILYQAWQARVRHFWLFVLAWSAPFLASFVRAAHGLGLVEYSFWLDNGNLIALSIESLLSTVLIVARLRDISAERDRARAGERTALRLANSDSLTGLLNRRAFIQLAIGRKQPHRLMLIDIDRFKQINDRLGHDTGDQVLRRIAAIIQENRPADSLAVRLGGEEFALLVPLARQEECLPDAILDAVRAAPMPLGCKVTVSLGFADGRLETEESWRRLYRLADSALYRAKSDGRDRVCRATDFAQIAAA